MFVLPKSLSMGDKKRDDVMVKVLKFLLWSAGKDVWEWLQKRKYNTMSQLEDIKEDMKPLKIEENEEELSIDPIKEIKPMKKVIKEDDEEDKEDDDSNWFKDLFNKLVN